MISSLRHSIHLSYRIGIYSSSKSLLANVLDIDDDFRCNHSCPTFLQQPTYYRTVYRYQYKHKFIEIIWVNDFVHFIFYFRGETDESIGTIADTRINNQYPQTCFGSSEYELALILKELRWITDQVFYFSLRIYFNFCSPNISVLKIGKKMSILLFS